MKKITVAIIGTGTVGGGVINILTKERAKLRKRGVDIRIKTVCAKNKPKSDILIPKSAAFTRDIRSVYEDPNIDVVVELISDPKAGGIIILNSLKKGKHVVSANKAALDATYPKIAALMSKDETLRVGIEAAVAGGIPVIGTMTDHMGTDPISNISGILNGTTNFIITKMEKEGLGYKEVLAEAQVLGYAEADPRADVEGYDARSKLSLLMQLAFGIHPHTEIPTTGISKISDIDFRYADMLHSTIRSLGVGGRSTKSVSGFVSPCIVSKDSKYASIVGATNAVSIDSEYLQNTFLVGQGAGRYPTAVSVVADIVRIAGGSCYSIAPTQRRTPRFVREYSGQFYIRLYIEDKLGVAERIGGLCKKHKISIEAILQLPIGSKESLPFVITTDTCTSTSIDSLVTDLEKLPFVREKPLTMPIIK